jgi:hypothetical protein
VGSAFLDSGSITGTTLNLTNGQLKVATNGITDNELNANSVTTAKIANDAVTYAKIQDVAASSVIGNTTAIAANPTNVAILDEDDMATDSATSLATQQSIKAYVDNIVPIGKYGYRVLDASNDFFFWDSATGGTQIKVAANIISQTYHYQANQGDPIMVTISIGPGNQSIKFVEYTDPAGTTVIVGSFSKTGGSGHGYQQCLSFGMYPGSSFEMPTITGALNSVAVLKQS